jgi:hypothetical protein
MTPTHFVVAKYIADRRKMEPRNIGIIAWNDGLVRGRFAGETEGLLKPPRFIAPDARKAYGKVIASWRYQFDKPELPIGNGCPRVSRSSPEFLQAIQKFSQENFILVEGGHVTGVPLEKAVDRLFNELVDDSNQYEARERSGLQSRCDSLFAELDGNERFHKNLPVKCSGEENFPFTFTYGFGDAERPEVLLQVVAVANEAQVTSAAMKFRCVAQDDGIIPRDRCACLIDARSHSQMLTRHITFLNRYCDIVNVSDPQAASRQLNRMGLPLLST